MALDRKQMESLKAALDLRRAALLAELRQDAANVRAEPYAALAGETRDAGDESVADALADTRQAELARDLAELREVERALASGRYGICNACGADIPFERLGANPAASRCASCQERHEKLHPRKTSTL